VRVAAILGLSLALPVARPPLSDAHIPSPYGTYAVHVVGNLFVVRCQMGYASIQSMAPYQHQETDQFLVAVNEPTADRVALSGPGHTFSHTNRLTASNSA
jgi:hypothetical protein